MTESEVIPVRLTVRFPVPLYSCTSIVADVLCPGTTVADEDPSPIAFPSSLYAVAVKLQFPGAASAFVHEGVLSLSSNETVEPSGAVPTTVYFTASGDTSEAMVLSLIHPLLYLTICAIHHSIHMEVCAQSHKQYPRSSGMKDFTCALSNMRM